MTDGIESERTAAGVTASYRETESERVLAFRLESGDSAPDGRAPVIAQNQDGYAMLTVRLDGEELERYYGFDVALDHVGELLGVPAHELPVPEEATDMGM